MGNVGFDTGHYPQHSLFVKAARQRLASMEQLTALLNDEGKQLFEQYCSAEADIEDITRYDTFTSALKFGILLMAEICMDGSRKAGEATNFFE